MIPAHQAQPANPAVMNVHVGAHAAAAVDGPPGDGATPLSAEDSPISRIPLPVQNADGGTSAIIAEVHITSADYTATAIRSLWVDHGSCYTYIDIVPAPDDPA